MMGLIAGCFSVSANLSNLYVLFGVYSITWFCLRLEHLVRPRKISSATST